MLVAADIGGTRARFATVDERGVLGTGIELRTEEYADAAGLLASALRALETTPERLSLAVAGPLAGNAITLVNRGLLFDAHALASAFDCPVHLWNDFEALARGVLDLDEVALVPLGGEHPAAPGPVAVIGPGTGLGTALVDPASGQVWPSEGGHADLAPSTAREGELLEILRHQFPRVSQERVLSGPGLENLYRALCELEGATVTNPHAEEIVTAARRGDPRSTRCVDLFVAWLGSAVGNFVMITGARSVRLAGGLAVRLAPELQTGTFRVHFEDKGRLTDWVRPVPVDLVLDEGVGLRGAALLGRGARRG
ncbi:MAG TPA: ROK family protein [Pseudomonadales bacterium]|nr:ROK family protein [Pseudomonadales bacterium]